MNIQIVRSGKSNHDLTIHSTGMGTFRTDFVKRFNLEGKNVLIGIDKDDPEVRFVYFTIDPTGRDTNGFIVKKNSGQSYQFHCSAIAKQLKSSSTRFVFHNQVHQSTRGFIQLIRLENEAEEKPFMKKISKGKKENVNA